jgi:hypothetical protein
MTLPATPAQGGVSAADAPVPTYVGRWVSARIGTDFLTVVGARTHGREVRIAGAKSLTRIERRIELTGALTAEQRDRLVEIADRCPIKRNLEAGLEVISMSRDDS